MAAHLEVALEAFVVDHFGYAYVADLAGVQEVVQVVVLHPEVPCQVLMEALAVYKPLVVMVGGLLVVGLEVVLEVSFVGRAVVAYHFQFQEAEAANVPVLQALTVDHVPFLLEFGGGLLPFLSCKHLHLDPT